MSSVISDDIMTRFDEEVNGFFDDLLDFLIPPSSDLRQVFRLDLVVVLERPVQRLDRIMIAVIAAGVSLGHSFSHFGRFFFFQIDFRSDDSVAAEIRVFSDGPAGLDYDVFFVHILFHLSDNIIAYFASKVNKKVDLF